MYWPVSLPLPRTTHSFLIFFFLNYLLSLKFPLSRNYYANSIQHSRGWIPQLRHTGSAIMWMLMKIKEQQYSPFKLYWKTVLSFPLMYTFPPTFWGDLTDFGSTWKLLDCDRLANIDFLLPTGFRQKMRWCCISMWRWTRALQNTFHFLSKVHQAQRLCRCLKSGESSTKAL